ncbi:MAG TPA: PQQ-binding-like beta-propeller repeat protein [Ktedonobacterales bacterium]
MKSCAGGFGARVRNTRAAHRIAWAGALTLTLALGACNTGPTGHINREINLPATLGTQSIFVTVSLGQQVQNPGETLALNAQTGAPRWKTATGGTGGTPAVVGGAVYLATEDGSIWALDAASGKPRWSFTRSAGVGSQYGFDGYATVSGVNVFVSSDGGAVYALDISTGRQRWVRTWPHAGDTIYAAPAVDAGLVFVPVGGPDGGGYALNAATGAIVWQVSHVEGFDALPLVANGVVYFASQAPGTLVALDEKSGAPRWQTGSSGVNAAPVTDGNLIIVAGADEIVRAYHVQDGSPSWTFQTGGAAGNALIPTGAALTLSGGTLYAGSQGGVVYALSATTGKQLWSTATNSPIDSPPAVANGAIYAATESGKIFAFRASDGAMAWTYIAGPNALITSGPVVASASGR